MTNLHAALELAEQGFYVFPVWGVTPDGKCACGREHGKHLAGGKPGKRPAIRNWPRAASIDPQTIQRWWARHPHANIGIHSRGLVAIDIDGPEGHRSLQRLQRIGKLTDDGSLRATHDDWKRIIKTRHRKLIDNQQIARLKKRYVTSDGRGPARKLELLVELQKGGRRLGGGHGRPSVYRPTGLRELFPGLFSP